MSDIFNARTLDHHLVFLSESLPTHPLLSNNLLGCAAFEGFAQNVGVLFFFDEEKYTKNVE